MPSKKTKVNVAVIGAGRIGQVHARHLQYTIPQANLVGIADVNLNAAKACSEELGVQNYTDDYQTFLNNPDVNAVIICSSTDTHAPLIEEAAAAGKHIFCEKPVDHSLEKIDRALEAVAKAGVQLQVGFNRRFDPNFLAIREAIQANQMGDIQLLKITSRDPAPPPLAYLKVSGGMFLDMTIHDFDMARYLVGSEVKRIFAVGGARVENSQAKEAGDIDTAIITLEFENGVFGTIDNSRQAVYGYDQRVEVFGSKGAISAENNTPHRTVFSDAQGIHQPLPLNFFMDRYTQSYINEMQEFVDCVLNNRTPSVTGIDGRLPVVMALAAKRSLESGQPVALRDVDTSAIRV